MTQEPGKAVNWRVAFEGYIRVVEKFLNIAGLRHANDHPLAKSIAQLKHLLQIGVPTPDGMLHVGQFGPTPEAALEAARDFLATFFRLGMDSMYWLGPQGRYIPELENDEKIKRFLVTRLPDPEMCEDVLSEMSYRGYLKARGLRVDLTEDDGMPDMKVWGSNGAFHAEIKAIHKGSNPDRASKVIAKANKQIKRTPEGVGICAILVLETIQMRGDMIAKPGLIPDEIKPIIQSVEGVMNSSNCKSVAEAVVSWDEFAVLGTPPGWVGLHAVRRSVRVSHREARAPIPHLKLADLEPSATVHNSMLFKPSGASGSTV